MFRSSRDVRIDRALSSVLRAIDAEHEDLTYGCDAADPRAAQWLLNILSANMNAKRIKAYERARTLRARWRERVEAMDD